MKRLAAQSITILGSIAAMLISPIFLTNCSGTSDKSDLGGGVFTGIDPAIVVMRTADKDALMSRHSRTKWIELKKTSKGEISKMHAMLATGAAIDAERSARNYLQTKPGDLDTLLVLATALTQSRQFELAEYYTAMLDKKSETKAHALNIRGLALLTNANTEADYRAAQGALLASHKADRQQIAAGMNLGTLYLELGNPTEALGIFQETSQRCARCAAAVLGYGVAALRIKKYKDAESAFNEVLKKNANNYQAIYYLALTQFYGGKNKVKAENTVKRILQSEAQGTSEIRQKAQMLVKYIRGEGTEPDDGVLDTSFGGDDKTENILTGNGG